MTANIWGAVLGLAVSGFYAAVYYVLLIRRMPSNRQRIMLLSQASAVVAMTALGWFWFGPKLWGAR